MKTMRLAAAALLVAAVPACSDRTDNPVQPTNVTADAKGPTTGPIQEIIDALFPQPGLHQAASAKLATIKKHLEKGKIADAQQEAVSLSGYTTFHLNDGALLDPNGPADPTTAVTVAELNCELHNFVTPGTTDDIADCGTFADETGEVLDNGGAVGVIGPAGGVLLTPEGREGISVPAGATLIPRVFTIDPIAASVPQRGPLVEPRCIVECDPIDQYPLFGNFGVTPAEPIGTPDFLIPVTVGLCHLDPGDGDFAPPTTAVEQRLRMGHNLVGFEGTELEILPLAAAGFLTGCGGLNSTNLIVVPPPVIGLVDRALIGLAAIAMPVVQAVLPDFAYAAMMGKCCLGGLATKLSPFGAVDPGEPLPAQDPALESDLASPGSETATEVIFTNHTAGTVRVYWIDYQGNRTVNEQPGPYTELGPGRSYRQETFVGHLWVLTNLNDEGLAIYEAINGLGFAEFTGPVGQGPYPPPNPPVDEVPIIN